MIRDTTILAAGGFGQWRRVKDVAWTFQTVLKLEVQILGLFDRDYRSKDEIDLFLQNMKAEGLRCFVLERKEIENYALTVGALTAAINSRQSAKIPPSKFLTDAEIVGVLEQVSEGFRHDTFGQIVGHKIKFLQSIGSSKDMATISKESSIEFELIWSDLNKRLEIICGKDFIAVLSTYLQQIKGFSITTNMIVDALTADEVGNDLQNILAALDAFCSE